MEEKFRIDCILSAGIFEILQLFVYHFPVIWVIVFAYLPRL
jgi:hypothetical protein